MNIMVDDEFKSTICWKNPGHVNLSLDYIALADKRIK